MFQMTDTRGVYRAYLIPTQVERRALSVLAIRGTLNPLIDRAAFHRLHWVYLRSLGAILTHERKRYYRSALRSDIPLFSLLGGYDDA